MKKKLIWFIAGVVMSISFTAFAQTFIFSDQNSFESWYSDSVVSLNEMGVINGYSDGSFQPGNNVNRAELAVMLDRFYDKVSADIAAVDDQGGELTAPSVDYISKYEVHALLIGYEKFKDYDLPGYLKGYLVMAEAGFDKMDEAPDSSDFFEEINYVLPSGYTMYWDMDYGAQQPMYFHYVGERSGGDVTWEADEWFGPFWM